MHMHDVMTRFPDDAGGYASRQSNDPFAGNRPDDGPGRAQVGPQPRNVPPTNQGDNSPQGRQRRGRGFASMDPRRVSEIASMGGKAAHAQGVAHEWSPEEARAAGRKGGQASRGSRSRQTNQGGMTAGGER